MHSSFFIIFRKNFGDIEVDIFFDKYDFDYKRSVAAALAADDVTLELKDDVGTENVDLIEDLASARQEEEVADSSSAVNVDRPRSGKEARQRRRERIASALSRANGGDGGDADKDVEAEEEDQPVGYEEYERYLVKAALNQKILQLRLSV